MKNMNLLINLVFTALVMQENFVNLFTRAYDRFKKSLGFVVLEERVRAQNWLEFDKRGKKNKTISWSKQEVRKLQI